MDIVYNRIMIIAKRLSESGENITRADLAYELKPVGITNDSYEINKLVWDTYCQYNQDEKIRKAFYNNDRSKLLIDEYQMWHLIEQNDKSEVFSVVSRERAKGQSALYKLKESVRNALGNGEIDAITSKGGINRINDKVHIMFDKYHIMVGAYENTKNEIKNLTSVFAELRENIAEIYRTYTVALIDVFGDSIKAIAPEMFDYDSIQWLNVQGMLQNIELQYHEIATEGASISNEISDSITATLHSVSDNFSNSMDYRVAAVLSILQIDEYCIDSSKETMEMQQDMLQLRDTIRKDVSLVKGDMERLFQIYKILNELNIPKAEVFYRHSDKVFSSELQQLFNSLYQDESIKSLKAQRDRILEEYKMIEREILDGQANISFYERQITEGEQILSKMRNYYEEARETQPQKTFFLRNLLSFGLANTKYNHDVFEWGNQYLPIIEKYDKLNVDVHVAQEELESQKETFEKNIVRYDELKKELNASSRKILQQIKVNPAIKQQVLNHLESIIKLLWVAKDVMESGIDEELTETVNINDYESLELPVEINLNLQAFIANLRKNTIIGNDFTKSSMDEISSKLGLNKNPEKRGKYVDEDIQTITALGNETIQKGIDLFEKWTYLEKLRINGKLSEVYYKRELEMLHKEFSENLNRIDNKSAVLRETLKKINMAHSQVELKQGLMLLSDIEWTDMTEQDWNDFLNGYKTIEI